MPRENTTSPFAVNMQGRTAEVARALSTLTGQVWAVKPPVNDDANWLKRSADLTGPGGAELHLGLDWRTGRLTVSGRLPRDHSNQERPYQGSNRTNPSATVDPEKAPEKVAKDIQTRVLAGYLPLLAEGVRQVAAANAAENERQELADLLAWHGGRPRQPREQRSSSVASFYVESRPNGHDNTLYGNGEVYSKGSVKLELRGLTAEQAAAIVIGLRDPRRQLVALSEKQLAVLAAAGVAVPVVTAPAAVA